MQATRRAFVFLLAWLGLFSGIAAAGAGWTARVTDVSDGDSFRARRADGRAARVRLYGIDSPELAQEAGYAARKAARELLERREVRVEPLYRDDYGREVALVYAGETLVNLELVRRGAAWVYTRYCKERDLCDRMKQAEAEARSARAGLWRQPKPEEPWQWRRKHPRR